MVAKAASKKGYLENYRIKKKKLRLLRKNKEK